MLAEAQAAEEIDRPSTPEEQLQEKGFAYEPVGYWINPMGHIYSNSASINAPPSRAPAANPASPSPPSVRELTRTACNSCR